MSTESFSRWRALIARSRPSLDRLGKGRLNYDPRKESRIPVIARPVMVELLGQMGPQWMVIATLVAILDWAGRAHSES